MLRRCGFVLLLLLAPAVVHAQDVPEQLLPASTQLYLRYDGIAAHRASFDKSALGRMLQGDMGKFVQNAFDQAQDSLGSAVTVQELLQGVPPEKLKKLLADAAETPKVLTTLSEHGFILGVELQSIEPPAAQVTIIIPEAGKKPDPIFGAIRLGAALSRQDIKEKKLGDNTVHYLPFGVATLAWWIDGKHIVLSAGTDQVEKLHERLHAKKGMLPENPLFKKVNGFKQFETAARGFVDIISLVEKAGTRDEKIKKVIADLGVNDIKSVTYWSGFEDAAERAVMEMEFVGDKRRGALALLSGKPFKLSDVPPLPGDVINWTMTNLDLKAVYDEGLRVTESIVEIVSKDDLPRVKEAIKKINSDLGVDVRKDLIEALGDRLVQYDSPSEGPLTLGTTYLISVKDPKKLAEALEQAIKGAGKLFGQDVLIKKRKYRDVELNEVHVRQQGFVFLPTYAIHKGWLVVGFFPQTVQGYILRDKGELPAWKPGPRVQASLDKMPREFNSISYSDPRPTVRTLFSLAPLIGGTVRSFLPDSKFDAGLIPNTHEVNKYLFPNVSVSHMDGNTLRLETRASLALPVDLSNLDTFIIAQVVAGLAAAGK